MSLTKSLIISLVASACVGYPSSEQTHPGDSGTLDGLLPPAPQPTHDDQPVPYVQPVNQEKLPGPDKSDLKTDASSWRSWGRWGYSGLPYYTTRTRYIYTPRTYTYYAPYTYSTYWSEPYIGW